MTDCRTLVPWEHTDDFDETKLGDALIFNTDDSQCTSVSSPYGLKKTYYTIISDGQETHIYRGNGKAGVIKGRSTHIATVSAARSRALWSLFRHKPVPKVMLDNNDGLCKKPAEGEVMDAEGSFAKSSWYGEERFEPVEKDTHLHDEKSSPLYNRDGVQPGKKESQRKTNREMILRVPATAIPDDVFLIRFGRGASAATKASLKVGGENSVTIENEGITYTWCLDDKKQPALYRGGDKDRQVVWTSPCQVTIMGKTLHQAFPASLTFFPEIRPVLDAVLAALIVWEMKGGSEWLQFDP